MAAKPSGENGDRFYRLHGAGGAAGGDGEIQVFERGGGERVRTDGLLVCRRIGWRFLASRPIFRQRALI